MTRRLAGASFWCRLPDGPIVLADGSDLAAEVVRAGRVLGSDDDENAIALVDLLEPLEFAVLKRRVQALLDLVDAARDCVVLEPSDAPTAVPDLAVLEELTDLGMRVRLGRRTTPALVSILASADRTEAVHADLTLRARGWSAWPALRSALFAALSDARDLRLRRGDEDGSAFERIHRLAPVLSALPAPIGALVELLALPPLADNYDASIVVDKLRDERPGDTADALLDLVAADGRSEARGRALELFHGLIQRMGSRRIFALEPQLELPGRARAIMCSALARGDNDYIVAQIMLRHGWEPERALAALCRAAADATAKDRQDGESDRIGYDLGCDFQIVLESVAHAPRLSADAVELLQRCFDEGDGPLVGTAIEALAVSGWSGARKRLAKWRSELDETGRFEHAVPSSYAAGMNARFIAAFARIDPAPVRATFEDLFALSVESPFAGVALSRALPTLLRSDADAVVAALREKLEDPDPEVAREALLCVKDVPDPSRLIPAIRARADIETLDWPWRRMLFRLTGDEGVGRSLVASTPPSQLIQLLVGEPRLCSLLEHDVRDGDDARRRTALESLLRAGQDGSTRVGQALRAAHRGQLH